MPLLPKTYSLPKTTILVCQTALTGQRGPKLPHHPSDKSYIYNSTVVVISKTDAVFSVRNSRAKLVSSELKLI
jgi:hypothetical protein